MKTTIKSLDRLIVFVISLLLIQQSCSSAQKGSITSTAAATSKNYEILNPGEAIILYKYEHTAHSAKEADKYAPKYFFTTDSIAVLTQLTKENLKKTFPDNHAFHDALDAQFNNDAELIQFDQFHKMYKVNWIFKNHR